MRGILYLPDESPVLIVRKHWLILARDTIGTIVGGLLPAAILTGISTAGLMPKELLVYIPILTLIIALWTLVAWLALTILWTNYYLDVWVVTSKRVMNIEQIDLFNRRVVSWRAEDIREINVHIENVVQTFFNYGSIEIETAGSTADEYERIEGMPRPEHIREVILTKTRNLGLTAAPAVPSPATSAL